MKVYILLKNSPENSEIEGIYKDEASAKDLANRLNKEEQAKGMFKFSLFFYEVEAHEVKENE